MNYLSPVFSRQTTIAFPHSGCIIVSVKGVMALAFERITGTPEIFGGKPCIRGLRFTVSRLLGLLAAGETRASIPRAYPYLEPEDIDEALKYAACLANEEVVEFAK